MMRVLKTAVSGAVLLAGLAACGQSGNQANAAAPVGSGSAKACETGDVGVTITAQPAGDDPARMGLVAVTNTSDAACVVDGWLTFALVNAADEAVDVPTEKVAEPGAGDDIELKPGTSAFAGIKWTLCDKGDSSCGVGNTIRYDLGESTSGPAAELDGFPAAEQSGITMGSLKIGTLQPATQGVVAW